MTTDNKDKNTEAVLDLTDLPTVVDYCIVGGGVAGIYAGYRLRNSIDDTAERPSVTLIESDSRLGGRLLTLTAPGLPNSRVEVGGMRYIESVKGAEDAGKTWSGGHPWVTSLVDHLNLPTEPLAADVKHNICYLREDHSLRMSDLKTADAIPFNVNDDTKSELGGLVAYAAVKGLGAMIQSLTGVDVTTGNRLGNLTEDQRLQISLEGTYNGKLLSDTPLRYLLLRELGIEALSFADGSGGYDSVLHTWNVADGLWWNTGDFSALTKYVHVTSGYEQVPLVMAQEFAAGGGDVMLNSKVLGFTNRDDGLIEVEVDAHSGVKVVVLARNLILALPRRSLELLPATGPVLGDSDVRTLIEAVTPIPLFKLALSYPSKWWEKVSGPTITEGRSTTDLPVRQCYYWPTEDPDSEEGIILIYDDGTDLDYWANLRGGIEPTPEHPDRMFELPKWENFPAPPMMVDEVHRQLAEMHGFALSEIPAPSSASFRDWGEDPYGGGANFWPVGVRSYDVGDEIIQPVAALPVYIVGEAYSHQQGWVEGSLATTEQALRQMGVAAPSWNTTTPVRSRKAAATT